VPDFEVLFFFDELLFEEEPVALSLSSLSEELFFPLLLHVPDFESVPTPGPNSSTEYSDDVFGFAIKKFFRV
jgi:hypothetical protein